MLLLLKGHIHRAQHVDTGYRMRGLLESQYIQCFHVKYYDLLIEVQVDFSTTLLWSSNSRNEISTILDTQSEQTNLNMCESIGKRNCEGSVYDHKTNVTKLHFNSDNMYYLLDLLHLFHCMVPTQIVQELWYHIGQDSKWVRAILKGNSSLTNLCDCIQGGSDNWLKFCYYMPTLLFQWKVTKHTLSPYSV